MANEEKGFRNTHMVRTLWTDCDPAGIIFYGNYFRWMDEAAYYLFKAAGIRWEDWQSADNDILGIPLIGTHADFRSPCKLGDEVAIDSFVSDWGRSSFTVTHIFNNRTSGKLAAEGWEKRVWCTGDPKDPSTFASSPIPDDVRKALGG